MLNSEKKPRKTPEKPFSFFEHSNFFDFRASCLESITQGKIHEKYQEIREVLSLIKDYNTNPEHLSTLSIKLQEIETPPKTPEKILKNSRIQHAHFPSEITPNEENNLKKPKNSLFDDPLKAMIQKLQSNLAQNLEETKELKTLFQQSQLKSPQNNIKTSYLDLLQEPVPDLRKLSESSFGGKMILETGETLSPDIKGSEKKDKEKLINEISSAERKVFELQTQRFLNKIQELNKKVENLTKEKIRIEEKLEKSKLFLSKDKIFGKIACSRTLTKENLEAFSKESALLEIYEDSWLEITAENMTFYRDISFSEIFQSFIWSQIQDLSIFEKKEEPLFGFYVLKVLQTEGSDPEYWLIKAQEPSWEMQFLSIILKIHMKDSGLSTLLRKDQISNLLQPKDSIIDNNFQTNNNNSSSKDTNLKLSTRTYGRKSLKSSFHQMAINSGTGNFTPNNSPTLGRDPRKDRHLQSVSSKSLQPQRDNSFNINNKYQSTFDLKNQPSDSLVKKGGIEGFFQELKALNIMKNGFLFLKYGKYGDPHERLLLLSNCEKKIEWKAINKKTASYLEIEEIKDIKEGRNSSIFSKYKAKTEEQAILSFSIFYGNNKTLDLEANNKENKNKFIGSLTVLMKREKKGKNMGSPVKRIITEEVYMKQKSYKSSGGLSLMEGQEHSEKDDN